MSPSASVRHLNHSHSDHYLVLLNLNEKMEERLGDRPFKFQAAWLLHKQYYRWIEEHWVDEGGLMALLREFTKKFNAWNCDVFGSIFRRKRRARKRLEGLKKEMDEEPTVDLFRLEGRLKKEWTEILL